MKNQMKKDVVHVASTAILLNSYSYTILTIFYTDDVDLENKYDKILKDHPAIQDYEFRHVSDVSTDMTFIEFESLINIKLF